MRASERAALAAIEQSQLAGGAPVIVRVGDRLSWRVLRDAMMKHAKFGAWPSLASAAFLGGDDRHGMGGVWRVRVELYNRPRTDLQVVKPAMQWHAIHSGCCKPDFGNCTPEGFRPVTRRSGVSLNRSPRYARVDGRASLATVVLYQLHRLGVRQVYPACEWP